MSGDVDLERLIRERIDRRELLRRLGVGGAAVALPGILAACGGKSKTAATVSSGARKGGIFRMARNEEPLSFDPLIPSDNGSIWVLYN
jgi:hypothetical protein